MNNQIQGNLRVRGRMTSDYLTIPNETVNNVAVASDAAIDASKLQHRYQPVFAQESGTTASDATQTLHVVVGTAGTLVGFSAGCIVVNQSGATISVDLLKNGTSVLSAAISLTDADAARDTTSGTISDDTLAAGDVLEVSVTTTAGSGTLGKGVFAAAVIHEAAS